MTVLPMEHLLHDSLTNRVLHDGLTNGVFITINVKHLAMYSFKRLWWSYPSTRSYIAKCAFIKV